MDDLPALDPARFPRLGGVERPFFEHWWRRVLDPADPQRLRWLALEEAMLDTAAIYVSQLARGMDLSSKRVLDVGCQNGAALVVLAARGAAPVGLEIHDASVEAARVRIRCHGVRAEVHQGSACAMPYPDASFDGVLAANVIEHVDDPPALLRECARVLRPGGALYLDGPNRLSPALLRADPHYQLAFVSVLPGWLARLYVTRVRGRPSYDAVTFPIAFDVMARVERAGLRILPVAEPGPRWAPRSVRRVAASFGPSFWLLAGKPGG